MILDSVYRRGRIMKMPSKGVIFSWPYSDDKSVDDHHFLNGVKES